MNMNSNPNLSEQNKPLPAKKTINGMLYRLDESMGAYLVVEEEQKEIGMFGQRLANLLEQDYPVKYGRILTEENLLEYLLKADQQMEQIYEQVMEQAEQALEYQTMNILEKESHLNHASLLANELVAAEMLRILES